MHVFLGEPLLTRDSRASSGKHTRAENEQNHRKNAPNSIRDRRQATRSRRSWSHSHATQIKRRSCHVNSPTIEPHLMRRDSMTDASFPVTTITGHEYTPSSLLQSAPVPQPQRHGVPTLDGTQEDDGQISCICGYFDDDGWTVRMR